MPEQYTAGAIIGVEAATGRTWCRAAAIAVRDRTIQGVLGNEIDHPGLIVAIRDGAIATIVLAPMRADTETTLTHCYIRARRGNGVSDCAVRHFEGWPAPFGTVPEQMFVITQPITVLAFEQNAVMDPLERNFRDAADELIRSGLPIAILRAERSGRLTSMHGFVSGLNPSPPGFAIHFPLRRQG